MKKIMILVLVLLTFPAFADILGQVVRVADGDTLTLLTSDKEKITVRLAEIDTPENRQPYGPNAKSMLSNLVFNKNVIAKGEKKDRYGRAVAHIYVDNVWVNAELVKNGAAWVYRQYSNDPKLLCLELEAKEAKRGLWALPESERMSPWEWRKARRKSKKTTNSSTSDNFDCDTKHSCKEMSSCEEARYYFEQCGLKHLDRDGNGVPCEKLCKR